MNIIQIPFHDCKKWSNEGFRTRDAHLYQHFEKNDEVTKLLVVNRPVSRPERLIKYRHNRNNCEVVFAAKNSIVTRLSKKSWNININLPDTIRVLLEGKSWWDTAFRSKTVISELNEAIKQLEMDDSILIIQNPMSVKIADHIKHSLFVFDAIDNWLYHPQMRDKELIAKNYKFVEQHADLVTTVSDALRDLFSSNKNVCWIPNGVDIEYFRDAVTRNSKRRNKQVVGYVGKIQNRIDFELVERCVLDMPDTEFFFVGPVYSQVKRATSFLQKKYKNIKFIGDVHYSKLAKTMEKIDVAIIPHYIDDFTRSMNPLKLYEYLASGKPVVSTKVAGVENVSKFVFCASKDGFVDVLRETLMISERGGFDQDSIISSIPKERTWNWIAKEYLRCVKQVQLSQNMC